MKFSIKQNKLNKALSLVSRIAGNNKTATLPILNNVLIKVEKKQVSLITTNLDMAVETEIIAEKAEDGAITVPAKLFAEFISNLPSGIEINFSTDGQKLKIQAGSYESIINGAEAGDFPEMPDINEKKAVEFELSGEDFKTGLGQVIIASSADFARPTLTGVFFNTYEGGLYIAATDGYRLAELKLADKVKAEVEAVVPSGSLREVLNAVSDEETIKILFAEAQVRFRTKNAEITSKLIDGSFPNYRALLPEKVEMDVKINKDEMLRITKIAALFARQASGTLMCKTNAKAGTFSVAAIANEMGENDSTVKAKVKQDSKVSLNSRYLLDALNALTDEEINFGFSKVNSLEPILLTNAKSSNYRHIVMPMAGEE